MSKLGELKFIDSSNVPKKRYTVKQSWSKVLFDKIPPGQAAVLKDVDEATKTRIRSSLYRYRASGKYLNYWTAMMNGDFVVARGKEDE